jgi:hypothetical protein
MILLWKSRCCSSTPEWYRNFPINDSLIVTENAQGHQVTCIPLGIFKGRRLTEIIVNQVHCILGHLGAQKTNEYVCCWFWWPKIGKYINLFCKSCDICQATKTVNQKPQGFHCSAKEFCKKIDGGLAASTIISCTDCLPDVGGILLVEYKLEDFLLTVWQIWIWASGSTW